MNRTVTATYGSRDTVRNVVDDLVSSGIPREKILAVEDENVVKVITPEVTEPEVLDLLGRHKPIRMDERSGPNPA